MTELHAVPAPEGEQPDEPTEGRYITDAEVAAINAARRALRAIDDRLHAAARRATLTDSRPTSAPMSLTRVEMLAEVADEHLFDVLNGFASWLCDNAVDPLEVNRG